MTINCSWVPSSTSLSTSANRIGRLIAESRLLTSTTSRPRDATTPSLHSLRKTPVDARIRQAYRRACICGNPDFGRSAECSSVVSMTESACVECFHKGSFTRCPIDGGPRAATRRGSAQDSIRLREGELRECPTGLRPSTSMPHPCMRDSPHPPRQQYVQSDAPAPPIDPASSRRVRRQTPFGLDRLIAVATVRRRPHTGVTTPGSSRKEGCRFRFAGRRSRNRRTGGKRRPKRT